MSAAPYTPECWGDDHHDMLNGGPPRLERIRATVEALADAQRFRDEDREVMRQLRARSVAAEAALAAVTAERDAAREEQREACAKHYGDVMEAADDMVDPDPIDTIRATPLTATPLADRIKELEAELAEVRDWVQAEAGLSTTEAAEYLLNERNGAQADALAQSHQKDRAEARVRELEAGLLSKQGPLLTEHIRVVGLNETLRAELAAETALVEATELEMVRQAQLAHDSARADRERIGVLEAQMTDFRAALEQWFHVELQSVIPCECDSDAVSSGHGKKCVWLAPCEEFLALVCEDAAALSATPEAAKEDWLTKPPLGSIIGQIGRACAERGLDLHVTHSEQPGEWVAISITGQAKKVHYSTPERGDVAQFLKDSLAALGREWPAKHDARDCAACGAAATCVGDGETLFCRKHCGNERCAALSATPEAGG